MVETDVGEMKPLESLFSSGWHLDVWTGDSCSNHKVGLAKPRSFKAADSVTLSSLDACLG